MTLRHKAQQVGPTGFNTPDPQFDFSQFLPFKGPDAVWVKLVIPTAPKGVGRDQ
jgi:hypothetical protein